MTTTINNTNIRLEFQHFSQSRGAYLIIIYAYNNEHTEIFRVRTTDAGFIDQINEMKAEDFRLEIIDNVYYNHVIGNIEERLYEWIDKCDMEDIMNEANDQLGGGIFDYDPDFGNIYNYTNRYEGNDIDMTKKINKYVLSITGLNRTYYTKSEAIKGLVQMYSAD